MDEQKDKPEVKVNTEINFFGMTNFRNQNRRFGIKIDDRRRHMYVVGKTGMGKTTILENMVLNDIYAGHGVGVVDPHGDFAEKIIDFIPANRINDVVYFNPADIDYPIGFNILETIRPEQKHLVASGLMNVFKKIWPDVWSARMEYILNNTILALLDFPGTTLLGINRMLAEEDYRKRVVNNSKDPVVKAFWQNEFASYTEKFRTEAVAPIQNKIGQFLSASVIRNIVAQVKSRINIREIMDTKKIFIMNLSKGRIGEDNSRLLGGMLVTRLQLAAMERVDILEKDRKDFFLYVDEFQNFATESFANILSEARKYRLDLIMAHQYMEQLDEKVLAAVIGNVGTMVTFRVGSTDAEILAKEFAPAFIEEDLVNLPKYHIYLKLMIDGVASRPFSAVTLAPIAASTASMDKVIRVSRERYAVPREKIEDKIMRWSGLIPAGSDTAAQMEVDPDEEMFASAPKPVAVAAAVHQAPPKAETKPAASEPNRSEPVKKAEAIQPKIVATSAIVPQQNIPQTAQSNPPSQQPQQGQPGQGSKKKRKRKKKKRDSSNLPKSGESIMLVDPNQKGISLTQALGGHHHTIGAQQPGGLQEVKEKYLEPATVPISLEQDIKQEGTVTATVHTSSDEHPSPLHLHIDAAPSAESVASKPEPQKISVPIIKAPPATAAALGLVPETGYSDTSQPSVKPKEPIEVLEEKPKLALPAKPRVHVMPEIQDDEPSSAHRSGAKTVPPGRVVKID